MNVNLKQITMEIANLCQIIVAKWNIIVRSLSAHTFAQHDCFSPKIDIQFFPKIMSTSIAKSLAMNSTNVLNKMTCKPEMLLHLIFWCSFSHAREKMNILRLMYQLHLAVIFDCFFFVCSFSCKLIHCSWIV